MFPKSQQLTYIMIITDRNSVQTYKNNTQDVIIWNYTLTDYNGLLLKDKLI